MLNPDEDEEFVDAQNLKGKVDHSTAGAQLVWEELSKRDRKGRAVGQSSGSLYCFTPFRAHRLLVL